MRSFINRVLYSGNLHSSTVFAILYSVYREVAEGVASATAAMLDYNQHSTVPDRIN